MKNYPIQINNVTFGYEDNDILKNISLDIENGELFCLMGRNGCGKSTLIDCIFGVNKISSGEIKIMGKNLNTYKPTTLAKHISYVPQIHDKSFPYTVRQVVLMGRTIYTGCFGKYSKKDNEIVDKILCDTGIFHLANRPYTQISGGEMQMVMLARALVQQTEIIIMDEPTAHLDYYNELLFLEKVIRLVKEDKKTVIMATHSPNQAFFVEKLGVKVRVGLMKNGNVKTIGKPSEVLNSSNIKDTYKISSEIISTNFQSVLLPKCTV